eukprot:8835946-Lingulodinium_polyedra.AAC.1
MRQILLRRAGTTDRPRGHTRRCCRGGTGAIGRRAGKKQPCCASRRHGCRCRKGAAGRAGPEPKTNGRDKLVASGWRMRGPR